MAHAGRAAVHHLHACPGVLFSRHVLCLPGRLQSGQQLHRSQPVRAEARRRVGRDRQLRRAPHELRFPPRAVEHGILADPGRGGRPHRARSAARAVAELRGAGEVSAADDLAGAAAGALGDAADRRDRDLALAARPASRRDQPAAAVAGRGRAAGGVPVGGALGLARADHDHHLEHAAAGGLDLPRQPAIAAQGADRGRAGRRRDQGAARPPRDHPPPQAGDHRDDADVHLLDLQQFRLRLADHGRRPRPLHQRHGDRGVHEGVHRRPARLQLRRRHRHGRRS